MFCLGWPAAVLLLAIVVFRIMEIRPIGRKRGGSRATNKSTEPRAGRRGKKGAGDTSAGEVAKSRNFWTVDHMIALIRAKRDQDLHLAGLGHNSVRMKMKTWKWDDVEKRLVQMGVMSRKVEDCGKKWDSLYQQFKTVHKLMGESGKSNFFTLTPRERKERGFDFRMDECVYSEIKAMSRGDHTIHPTNLADTGVAGCVQMPCPRGGRNESGGSEGCGDGQDDDQGSTRDSTFSGVGGGGGGKRKNVRQQTFDTIADVMKDHGNLMATTVDSASKRQCSILTRQCDILERELEVQKEHYVKADQANFMMCNALLEIAKAIRAVSSPVRRTGGLRTARTDGRTDARMGVRTTTGPGKPLREAAGDCADYFVAIANGDVGAEPPAMLVMPSNDVPLFKIEDPAHREPALRRARNVEKLVLRTFHGWIFKSSSRSTGFARAESYINVDSATDVARAVWQGYEWSKVVSLALVYHTLAMKMDVPLWFAGVKIVDQPEDDDMAAR
ncbi:hypothetical protein CBR_g34781 [Chara braunii]|uniref:Myb/SANT-like DNA-binding domain-containing protein n=1 Tax=Chara braunii TaxID=69332 RepID=A0A388LJJ4_CHABU|nr:hypothetical protein CBR_g34781 [Chara braunii]|eukprot:GBG82405.1 hypothetical protein CBR_g34781 [Chara braunii]